MSIYPLLLHVHISSPYGGCWAGWIAAAWCRSKKVAATIKGRLWGILNAVVTASTNAIGESLNARIQKIKAMACAFRNRARFRRAILFHLGGLDLMPSGASYPTPTKP